MKIKVPLLRGGIIVIVASMSLNNQKTCSHKYGGIYPFGGVAAMETALELIK